MSKKKAAVVASAALAASSLLVFAEPASGALVTVTQCRGSAGAVTVTGDLIVPRNADCTLTGTTVTGDVFVQRRADLLLEGADVQGRVQVNRDAYLDVTGGTSIGGEVRSRNAYGVFVEDSEVGGDIVQRSPADTETEPFVYLFSTGVAGGLDSTAGEVLIESSQIEGDVSAVDGEYVDIVDSTLGANLDVRNNALGAVVCESEIFGDAVFADNQATLQIGGGGAVGPCDGASFWNGNVTFDNNSAGETGFDISNNIVRGDLSGTGNDPLPTGAGNRVRGENSLEFAEAPAAGEEAGTTSLQRQSTLSLESQAEAEVVAESRVADLQAKVEARRAAAEAGAARVAPQAALSPAPQG